jgi:beta-galactosidase
MQEIRKKALMRIFDCRHSFSCNANRIVVSIAGLVLLTFARAFAQDSETGISRVARSRISINEDWRFYKYDWMAGGDDLIYDVRPDVKDYQDDKPADAEPTEAEDIKGIQMVLKPWISPTGNDFIMDSTKRYARPEGSPGSDYPFVQNAFDDSSWESINLPHDWAIKGPFLKDWNAEVAGSMGRLPSPGVAWYRKKIDIPASDAGKCIFLDVDGAMSYAMVWLNGNLVGGWSYGYASWRVDLTPYIVPGGKNQLAIRLDNPPASSRWYPGGGIYRNVWLVKTHPVHVDHWSTFVTTRDVSKASATINLEISIVNDSNEAAGIRAATQIFPLNADGSKAGNFVAAFEPVNVTVPARAKNESRKLRYSEKSQTLGTTAIANAQPLHGGDHLVAA